MSPVVQATRALAVCTLLLSASAFTWPRESSEIAPNRPTKVRSPSKPTWKASKRSVVATVTQRPSVFVASA